MRRRTAISAILSVALIVAALFAPSAAVAKTTPDMTKQIMTLIKTYGPLIVLHPDEQYEMDRPEFVLNRSTQLEWGLVYNADNADNPLDFNVDVLGSTETSANAILADEAIALQDPNASSLDFDYWVVTEPNTWNGHAPRAKSYVRLLTQSENVLDLQFWFYYPYNGPVKAKADILLPSGAHVYQNFYPANVGRHQGDWEHVTLRFNQQNDTGWTLDSVFLSQHSTGEWLAADELSYSGSHPIVYSALDSHANYATIGEHLGDLVFYQSLGPGQPTLTVNQLDITDAGKTFAAFNPGNVEIVSSDVQGVKTPNVPDWYSYDGLWGPYELHIDSGSFGPFTLTYPQVDKGPLGPAQHTADPTP